MGLLILLHRHRRLIASLRNHYLKVTTHQMSAIDVSHRYSSILQVVMTVAILRLQQPAVVTTLLHRLQETYSRSFHKRKLVKTEKEAMSTSLILRRWTSSGLITSSAASITCLSTSRHTTATCWQSSALESFSMKV